MFRRLVNSLSAEDRRKVDFNAGLAWQVGMGDECMRGWLAG